MATLRSCVTAVPIRTRSDRSDHGPDGPGPASGTVGGVIERDIGFVESAPVRIEATAVVRAPRQAVWDVLVDHRHWPEWFGSSLRRCEPTSSDEAGVGSTRTVVLRGGAEIHEQFIVWDEPELWAFTAVAMSPAAFTSLVERVVLAPLGDHHTRATYTMALTPTWWMRPVVPLLRLGVRRSLTGALAGLGRTVERGVDSPVTGG